MYNVVPFPNSNWTEGKVRQHPIYGRLDDSNPLYLIWKENSCSGSNYYRDTADFLNQVDDPISNSDFMGIAEKERSAREVERHMMRVERKIERDLARRQGLPISRSSANRTRSSKNRCTDGRYVSGAQKFASQYQYRVYRTIKDRLVEDIDFHLDAKGVVRSGPPEYY
jgi:hypothetical protein